MLRKSLVSMLLGLVLSGCATDGTDAQVKIGTVIGSLAGDAASHQLGDDKAEMAAAAIGSISGARVGAYMHEQRRLLEKGLAQELKNKQLVIENLTDDSLRLILQNEFLFEFDGAEIKGSAEAILKKLAEHLIGYNQIAVHVVGHTDSAGAAEYNLHLSERRASSVARMLNRQGVPASRIRIEGRGENEPREPGDTEQAKQSNRRLEIYLRPIIDGNEEAAYASPSY